jgi:hypothetical protein
MKEGVLFSSNSVPDVTLLNVTSMPLDFAGKKPYSM